MSWTLSVNSVIKEQIDATLDGLPTPEYMDGPMKDQLRVAKQAVKQIVANVPGPHLAITMSGHANGVGWQKKDGWVNDFITISIQQLCEADVP
jgi:hypothetical protein